MESGQGHRFFSTAADLIRIIASDDIEVVAVDDAIHTTVGIPVEHGHAAQVRGLWCYRAAVSSARLNRWSSARSRAIGPATKFYFLLRAFAAGRHGMQFPYPRR
jgi:hypothetical protein